MNNILCIYHGNCADGFGAAWAVWKAHPNAQFHAGVYGQPAPNCQDMDVYLVDFSYKGEELQHIIETANSVTIIDHHKTAQADIQTLLDEGKVKGIFDMSKSGAVLTWEWFHPDKVPPVLLEHIQDRDLWQFKLPYTREISAAIFSYGYDFDVWDDLVEQASTSAGLEKLIDAGEALERKHFKDIRELIPIVKRPMNIAGYEVLAVSLPYTMASDACHILAAEYGQPFGVSYYDTPTGRTFSLRSMGDFDVSEIAKKYGGGGHKNAAGFSIPMNWEEIE